MVAGALAIALQSPVVEDDRIALLVVDGRSAALIEKYSLPTALSPLFLHPSGWVDGDTTRLS